MAELLMNLDDPFDYFDINGSISAPLDATPKKRKKVIGLDDLFNDRKKEEAKNKKKKSKVAKARKIYVSDEDEEDGADETEIKLTEALQNFQKTISEVDGKEVAITDLDQEDVTLSWGLQVFGAQRTLSPLDFPELEDCMLLQNSGNNKLSTLLDHSSQMGETFLRRLLLNGWLSNLIINCGYLEESIAKWTFNMLFYSSDESLMTSACDFWCAILVCKKVDAPVVNIDWLPGLLDLKRALESFGFQWHSPANISPEIESPHSNDQSNHNGSDCKVPPGPPINIRAWIKFAKVCCQIRSKYLVFSTLEAEELVGIIAYFFLERKLLGLTSELHECLISAVNYFEDKEWNSSCQKVATFLADSGRVPRDSNCLRIIECISGVDTRSKQLRSTIAAQVLRSCFNEEMTEAKDVLKFLISINLKNKSCDLIKIYLYLVLTENWLIFGAKAKPMVYELWNKFIWKCSSQISNTDFRPCAQEIRSRASYLLQSTTSK